jgi:hypothetical protein
VRAWPIPRAAALALLLTMTSKAETFAQTVPRPAQAGLDPAAEAAARELFEASNVRATMRDSNEKIVAQMRSGAALSAFVDQNPQMRMKRATNPQAWDAALARLGAKQAAVMETLLTSIQPEVEARTIQLYAQTFSVAELKGMTAFYRTPLGRQMIEKMPALLSQTMSWMQTEIPRRLGPAMAQLQPEIQRELAPLMSTPK